MIMGRTTFRIHADESHVGRAIEELHLILLGQHFAYTKRFQRGLLSVEGQALCRRIGMVASGIGVALSIYILFAVPPGCGTWWLGWLLLGVFGLAGLLFQRLLDLQAWVESRIRLWVARRFGAHAAKNLEALRSATPIELEYQFEDGRVWSRQRSGQSMKKRWERPLESFAFVGDSVCAIFKKSTAMYPRMLVLHDNGAELSESLRALGIEIRSAPRAAPPGYELDASTH